MQQNHTNSQTEKGKGRERKRDQHLDTTEPRPCLVSTAPGVESCKMSPVYADLSCLLQGRRWPDIPLPWACPFSTVSCQVSFVWLRKLPPAVPTALKKKKIIIKNKKSLSFFLLVLFQHYYSSYFSHTHTYIYSLAYFRSVSYRERMQRRREKALGFLEHE